MRVGVHCSIRKGFVGALEEAHALGCDTLQIFTQSPRGWQARVYLDSEFEEFRIRRRELKLDPLVVHSPYLPNLCTSNPLLYKKSVGWLREDLKRCEKLGAEYLVIHPGSFSPGSSPEDGLGNLIEAINRGLEAVSGKSVVLIENMAGGGRRVGSTFEELAAILGGIDQRNRIGICFDTCHASGAGYDLSSTDAVKNTLDEFEKSVGLDNIRVFHVNDSKGEIGDHRDRHEHIGKGVVGLKGFKALFSWPQFSDRILILETPKDPAPKSDLKNLKVLRSLLPEHSGKIHLK